MFDTVKQKGKCIKCVLNEGVLLLTVDKSAVVSACYTEGLDCNGVETFYKKIRTLVQVHFGM